MGDQPEKETSVTSLKRDCQTAISLHIVHSGLLMSMTMMASTSTCRNRDVLFQFGDALPFNKILLIVAFSDDKTCQV
jgi:hypothetical protein